MKTYATKISKKLILFTLIFSGFMFFNNTDAANDRPYLVNAAEKTVNSVVHIKTVMVQKSNVYAYFYDSQGNLYRQGQKPNYYVATGSGVILTSDGYIVTNNHVVAGASEILVTLNDKRSFKAKIVGRDPGTDLAVVKIDTKELQFLNFGNSDAVRIGEWVLAVGNPFNLTSTVTAGIVSAKARDIHLIGPQYNSAVYSYIQTDAAINPGNSGGALVNEDGLLIGINAAIASNTGSYTGYSFAIPSNIVKKVVGDIIQYGAVKRAYLGIQMSELTEEVANYLGMNKIEGVFVAKVVPNGAADKAGIRDKDIILKVNMQSVNSRSELVERMAQYEPGENVIVRILRNKQIQDFSVKLDSDTQQ